MSPSWFATLLIDVEEIPVYAMIIIYLLTVLSYVLIGYFIDLFTVISSKRKGKFLDLINRILNMLNQYVEIVLISSSKGPSCLSDIINCIDKIEEISMDLLVTGRPYTRGDNSSNGI